MKRTLASRAFPIAAAGLLLALAGCDSRGTFTADACPKADRTALAVPPTALAVYFDKNGNQIGTKAELMRDTKDNVMCGIDPAPGGGGTCNAPNICAIPVPALGKTFCAPPPCPQ